MKHTSWMSNGQRVRQKLFFDDKPPHAPRYQPDNCPHCEYDRRFPETADGGWIHPGNNAALAPCPMCNPHGTYKPRL